MSNTNIRKKLGDFSSIVCLKALIVRLENILGEKGDLANPVLTAGKCMFNNTRALSLVIFAITLFPSNYAHSKTPDVPVSFPDKLSCTPGELLHRSNYGMGRVTNIIYHNGHFYTNNVGGVNKTAREFVFSNINDPKSFTQVFTPNLQSISDAQSHGHTKVGDYLSGYARVGYPRTNVGVNDVSFNPPLGWITAQQQSRAEGSRSHRMYYPWSVPFNWQQYGPTSGIARLYRADELLAEWNPLTETGVPGTSILLGNILLVASDASNSGVAAYDISPVFNSPQQPPQLVGRLANVGGYLASIWENYLLLVSGANHNQLVVIDFSDPTDLSIVKTFNLSGTQGYSSGGGLTYIQTQDQYIFTRRHKIDMENLTIVLEYDEAGNNRPLGSLTDSVNMSQYHLPLGNLLVTGSNRTTGRDAIGIWCHQSTPDTRGPYVGYHIPRDGQVNFPLGAPISLAIAEELESFTIINGESIIVHPIDGQAIDAITSFSHDGILTFTPDQYLQPDTTYKVNIPDGGIKDISGNGIQPYSFTFSTGSSVNEPVNMAPVINSVVANKNPSTPGASVFFTVNSSDAESDELQYRFNFGDGTAEANWTLSPSINHTYTQAGNYTLTVQTRDIKPDGPSSTVTKTLTQTVVASLLTSLLPVSSPPVSSSMLSLDHLNRIVWTVNPDNDSVSRIDADSFNLLDEFNLKSLTSRNKPIKPTSVAIDNNGRAWIVARDANLIVVLTHQGDLQKVINTGYGSRPQAVLISPDGSQAYVSMFGRGSNNPGNGKLVRYRVSDFVQTGQLELGQYPGAMALSGNGDRLFIAALISAQNYGKIWEVNTVQMSLTNELRLHRDRGADGLDAGGTDGPGVPNYLADLVISPDEQWLWYTAIKTDTNRGLFFKQQTELNLAFTPDSTVRSMIGRLDLSVNPTREPEFGSPLPLVTRVDIDNADSPSSIAFSPTGSYAFVTLQGNNTLAAFDALAIQTGNGGITSRWRTTTGSAPQASLMDASNNRLWVKNLLSRDLSVINLDPFLSSGSILLDTTHISTVQNEQLNPNVLAGKKHFYFAGNDLAGVNEMSFEGYISCASCHIDGSHDGRVWDFTERGEGLRNTIDLRGRRGTGHGNLHWSANFDEVQDFVLDITNHFGGTGFLNTGENPNPSLSLPNTNLRTELDQLSAYVSSLDHESIPQSPYRTENGFMTLSAQAGRIVFEQNACADCHLPTNDFTDSVVSAFPQLHNVGTIRTSSGQRLGNPLTGLDTPTLLGVWDTPPYFHDGSAQSLEDVFITAGGINIQAEFSTLIGGAYVQNTSDTELRQDSSAHGQFVVLPQNSAGLRLSSVDGGAGGVGAITLRVMVRTRNRSAPLSITVNGITHTTQVTPSGARLDWVLVRIDDVSLQAEKNNTVTIKHIGGSNFVYVDEMIISRSNDLNKANPHRRVSSLSTADTNSLLAYLRELDGSNSSVNIPPTSSRSILGNGDFEQGSEAWLNLNSTRNRTLLTGSSQCSGGKGHCLRLNGSQYRHVDTEVNVSPLATYNVSGSIKVTNNTRGKYSILVRWYNNGTTVGNYIRIGRRSSNSSFYQQFKRNVSVPAGVNLMRILLVKSSNSNGIGYFDDIKVIPK